MSAENNAGIGSLNISTWLFLLRLLPVLLGFGHMSGKPESFKYNISHTVLHTYSMNLAEKDPN
jgi:hypothetical protein